MREMNRGDFFDERDGQGRLAAGRLGAYPIAVLFLLATRGGRPDCLARHLEQIASAVPELASPLR